MKTVAQPLDHFITHLDCFAVTGNGECVGGQRSLRLGIVEVDDRAVVLDHVDLLDAGDHVDGQLLQQRLQLLVVGGGGRVHNLLLAPGRSLAADTHRLLQLLQLFGVHCVASVFKRRGALQEHWNRPKQVQIFRLHVLNEEKWAIDGRVTRGMSSVDVGCQRGVDIRTEILVCFGRSGDIHWNTACG